MFEKVIKSAKLVTLPDIYLRLKELLSSPGFRMMEVAALVNRSPGIAARFLQFVNSPLNRRLRNIESIDQAVNLSGINQVHDIVLSISIAKTFEGLQSSIMDVEKFSQQSFYCAVTAKLLASESDKKDRDRLFAIGLLHDIGHLAMYTAIPEEAERAILTAREQKRPLYRVERELLGFDYAEVGKQMTAHWSLPDSYQSVIGCHPEPAKADQFALETALLHISHLLVCSDMEGGVFGQEAYSVDPGAWETTGLTEEQCLSVRQTAARQYKSVQKGY